MATPSVLVGQEELPSKRLGSTSEQPGKEKSRSHQSPSSKHHVHYDDPDMTMAPGYMEDGMQDVDSDQNVIRREESSNRIASDADHPPAAAAYSPLSSFGSAIAASIDAHEAALRASFAEQREMLVTQYERQRTAALKFQRSLQTHERTWGLLVGGTSRPGVTEEMMAIIAKAVDRVLEERGVTREEFEKVWAHREYVSGEKRTAERARRRREGKRPRNGSLSPSPSTKSPDQTAQSSPSKRARRRRSAPSSIPGNLEDDIPVATTTTSPPVVQPPVPPLQAVNAYNLARYDEKENFSPSGTQASAIICLNLGSTHITPKPILRPPPPAHIYKKPHTPAETLAELLSSHSNSASIATESSSAEEEDCQNPAAQDPVPKPLAERATPTNRPDPLSTVKTSASEAKSKAQPLLPIALIPAQQPITPSSREITPVTPKSNPRITSKPTPEGQKGKTPTHRYTTVERSKHIRAQLHARDCPCCSDFYKVAGTDPPTSDPNASSKNREARIGAVSRHRDAYFPPPTPPGFWEPDMATTQERLAYNKQALEDAAARKYA